MHLSERSYTDLDVDLTSRELTSSDAFTGTIRQKLALLSRLVLNGHERFKPSC